MSAVEMLRAIGDGQTPDFTGQRVCVVGGGNVAMDVARSAVRLRRREGVTSSTVAASADMTAQDAEIAGAQRRGLRDRSSSRPRCAIEVDEAGTRRGLARPAADHRRACDARPPRARERRERAGASYRVRA